MKASVLFVSVSAILALAGLVTKRPDRLMPRKTFAALEKAVVYLQRKDLTSLLRTSTRCYHIARHRAQVLDVLDPTINDRQFLDRFEEIVIDSSRQPSLINALKHELTDANVVYVARRLCLCHHIDAVRVRVAVQFLIDECDCRSLAGFMMGAFIDLVRVRNVDLPLITDVLVPHYDRSVLYGIPDPIWDIINHAVSPNEIVLREEFPERFRDFPDFAKVAETLLENHHELIRGNRGLLSALLQIGVSFSPDLLRWRNLAPKDLHRMGPYLCDIGFEFYQNFPELIATGSSALIVEFFRHRTLVHELTAWFLPDLLYLFCYIAVKFELRDVLDCLLGIPQVLSEMKRLAAQPVSEAINHLQRIQQGNNPLGDINFHSVLNVEDLESYHDPLLVALGKNRTSIFV